MLGLPIAADIESFVLDPQGTSAASSTTALGTLSIPARTTWFIQQLVANVTTASQPVEVIASVAGTPICRLFITDAGGYALDNAGWPVSAQIGPSASAVTVTFSGRVPGGTPVSLNVQAILIRAHDNPAELKALNA